MKVIDLLVEGSIPEHIRDGYVKIYDRLFGVAIEDSPGFLIMRKIGEKDWRVNLDGSHEKTDAIFRVRGK